MLSWAEEVLAGLQPIYEGHWDLWIVPLYPTGHCWCAKPAGTGTATVNAGTPEQLVAAIAAAEQSDRTD
jgi:hypothetical protein